MTFDGWKGAGREVAVLGLGRSGSAAARLLAAHGVGVYASDAGESAEVARTAAALAAEGVAVDAGRHDHDRIARSVVAVLSPGIPPGTDVVRRARKAGVPIRAEVDVGLEALTGIPYVAITGTNGKTTTTALVAHLLESAGRRARATGNIGTPVSAVALDDESPEWMAVELSSFQLHDSARVAPNIGILTNLSPDHLDRYASVEEYYADKARLFLHATPASVWVTETGRPEVDRMLAGIPGRRLTVSLDRRSDGWFDRGREGGMLMLGDEPVLPRRDLALLGDHNVTNALMASLATQEAGLTRAEIGAGLRTFQSLAHRLEPVREVGGVLWINDSKATNIASTEVAVAALDRPFVLLLGGRHKGEAYTRLAPLLEARCRAVIAYGEAAPLVRADLQDRVRVIVAAGEPPRFAGVVETAGSLAQPGDAVLLSPACSSYDMFRNYEERGAAFRALVESR